MNYFWNVHDREDINFTSGEGVYLLANKKGYLDLNAGGAVNSLGYNNKKLIEVLKKQADKIWHLSNYYQNKMAEKFAEELCLKAGMEKAFFLNSGTEGIELAIKTARKFFFEKGPIEIIALKNAFHGRTMGALSATHNPIYKKGFGDLLSGFIHTEPTITSIKEHITSKTAAIIVEPIQGEGGINFLRFEFLKELRTLCDEKGILLILDEVQTGMGRTGKLFAFQHAGIAPDILVLAKGIASGFPFGAVLTSKKIADSIQKGNHGGTFGGNLLGLVVASEVLKQISTTKFLKNVQAASKTLQEELHKLKLEFPKIIEEVKGFGLMRGIKLNENINLKELTSNLALKEQVLFGKASGNVLRITPPLIITPEEIKMGIQKLRNQLEKL